jgi:hypothetical protein
MLEFIAKAFSTLLDNFHDLVFPTFDRRLEVNGRWGCLSLRPALLDLLDPSRGCIVGLDQSCNTGYDGKRFANTGHSAVSCASVDTGKEGEVGQLLYLEAAHAPCAGQDLGSASMHDSFRASGFWVSEI